MAKSRDPRRDEARQIWVDSGGVMPPREIAERVGARSEQVRKWKSADKWEIERRRGGQPGNRNAAGCGAPEGNKNAETHGAYSTVNLGDLPPEQREYIENLTLDTNVNMLAELQLLIAKEADLRQKIYRLEHGEADELYVDRVVDVRTPSGGEMQTTVKSSAFERAMKLESELNKTHGRIIKLLDSIKAYELESKRVELEQRKYSLAKQRLAGEYEIDPDTGEINDEGGAEG